MFTLRKGCDVQRVLIVDVDVNALNGLVELLRDEGYETWGASHGTRALELAAEYEFDRVVSTQRLPDMSGILLCRRLKRLQPDSTFFLLTDDETDPLLKRAPRSGVDRIFSKPIVIDELLLALAAA